MDVQHRVVFHIRGKRPDQAELEKMTSLPYVRHLPGGGEVEDAIKWFLIEAIAGIVLFLFGRWVTRGSAGLGVLLLGYVSAYCAAPVSVAFGLASLCRLLCSVQKVKPADALHWTWMTSILGDGEAGERLGELLCAASAMRRLIPRALAYDELTFERYVDTIRSAIVAAAEETTSFLRQGDWDEAGPNRTCEMTHDEELLPNLRELSAVVTYTYMDMGHHSRTDARNQSACAMAAQIELRITQCYVRSGRHWFPYDYMPTCRREGQWPLAMALPAVVGRPAELVA